MPYPPLVTGISPIEGLPGTRVTIRGENLGFSMQDIIGLTICGQDCFMSAEWKSPNKIIARSGAGKGEGDIIITTRSAGVGTSTVIFKSKRMGNVDPLKESAVWVQEKTANAQLSWDKRRTMLSNVDEDPLGLMDEGGEKKIPEEELMEMFPDGSGNLNAENFVAIWWLLENHNRATFEDLKAGLGHLKRSLETQQQGHTAFLKDHIGSVMEQVDTLQTLKEKLEVDGPHQTETVSVSVSAAKDEADKLFQEVLRRKDQADRTRNALTVLQRFRFLFSLPGTIERNTLKGDYGQVINDYARAKLLFRNTDLKCEVFRRVHDEVESSIARLQTLLWEKLRVVPQPLEKTKKLIKHLVNVEAEGDPGWVCILAHQDYTLQVLLDSKKNLEGVSTKGEELSMISDICQVLTHHLPDLWRLGQAYFSEELHVKPELVKKQPFQNIIQEDLSVFCALLRAAYIPELLNTRDPVVTNHGINRQKTFSQQAVTPPALQILRSTHHSLLNAGLGKFLKVVNKLILDFRVVCLQGLLSQGKENILNLKEKETWDIDLVDGQGGVTKLPVQLETVTLQTVTHVKECVMDGGESDLLSEPQLLKKYTDNMSLILSAFVKVLQESAFEKTDESAERRLLITLSNCHHTSSHILPRLRTSLKQLGFPDLPDAFRAAEDNLGKLEHRVVNSYLDLKCEPLIGRIEPAMYTGRFDYDTCLKPKAVRPYLKEVIISVMEIHAQVHSLAPSFLGSILRRVVSLLSEELSRLCSCVAKWNSAGCLQARLDLAAFQEAVNNYLTPQASSSLREAWDVIPPVGAEESKSMRELLSQFKQHMRFELAALKTPS